MKKIRIKYMLLMLPPFGYFWFLYSLYDLSKALIKVNSSNKIVSMKAKDKIEIFNSKIIYLCIAGIIALICKLEFNQFSFWNLSYYFVYTLSNSIGYALHSPMHSLNGMSIL